MPCLAEGLSTVQWHVPHLGTWRSEGRVCRAVPCPFQVAARLVMADYVQVLLREGWFPLLFPNLLLGFDDWAEFMASFTLLYKQE